MDQTQVSLAEQYKKLMNDVNDVLDDMTSSINKLAAGQQEVLNYEKQSVNLNNQERRIKADIAKLTDKNGKLLKQATKEETAAAAKRLEQLKTGQALVDKAKAQAIRTGKVADAMKNVQEQAAKLIDPIQNFVEALPGGKALSRLFGLDTLKDGFDEVLNATGAAFFKNMKETNNVTQASAAAMKQFSKSAGLLLNPITLVVAAVGGLVLLFNSISKEAKELAKETGLTYGQAALLAEEARDVASGFATTLATAEDILAVQKATLPVFGTLNMLTTEQAAAVADLGRSFGYGAEQAAKINNAFLSTGVSAEEAANTQRDLAAEAVKAGVNVGTVVSDIADNAKELTKFFGGNIKALKDAAIQAAKLGMSIKEMAKVSDTLLQFEESISSQFELQALTGRQVNFDLARQKALQGDIAGATKEVLNQVGGIAEFNEMDVIQRQALAKATGLSVDELQKSLTIQEKLKDAGPEQIAAATKLGLSAAELKDMSAEDLQNKVAQQQATDKLGKSFDSIKNTMMNALMPLAEGLMDIFSALSPVFTILGKTLKIAFMPITLAVQGIRALVDLIAESTAATITFGVAFSALYLMKKNSLGVTKAELALQFLKNKNLIKEGGIQATISALGKKDFYIDLASAAMTAFKSVAKIPIVGPILGAAAAAGAVALGTKLINKTGDLGIDPNGGPIVATPTVGGIKAFQGDRRDGVSMGPTMGTNPDMGGGGGGGSIGIDYQRMAQAIVTAMTGLKLQPAPIQIGSQVINAISDEMEVIKSYK